MLSTPVVTITGIRYGIECKDFKEKSSKKFPVS